MLPVVAGEQADVITACLSIITIQRDLGIRVPQVDADIDLGDGPGETGIQPCMHLKPLRVCPVDTVLKRIKLRRLFR